MGGMEDVMPIVRKPYQLPPRCKELLESLVAELLSPTETGPLVTEEEDVNRRWCVQVIWSAWAGVDRYDRESVIREAYRETKHLGPILVARGLTPEEDQIMGPSPS